MGQYYRVVILAENEDYIRAWVDPLQHDNGMKLMEHSYVGNNFVDSVEFLISPKGPFYKCRVVWAGDYADIEPDSANLFHLAEDKLPHYCGEFLDSYSFVVNHTKKLYVDKVGMRIHPMPLLTAEGNGRGGGDYRGADESLVGTWARDILSVEKSAPSGYTELICGFREN